MLLIFLFYQIYLFIFIFENRVCFIKYLDPLTIVVSRFKVMSVIKTHINISQKTKRQKALHTDSSKFVYKRVYKAIVLIGSFSMILILISLPVE